MILELSVDNIAIIERAHIELGSGFTAITGETGAGKSLLVDAIGLALGGRADSQLVRSGSSRGVVALVVDLKSNPEALQCCRELGVDLEDGKLFVQREITAEGRSSARLAGKMIPVGILKRLGDLLVDLHGQHDHQSLLDPESHIDFLDAWIGEAAHELRSRVSVAFDQAAILRAKLASSRRSQRDREQRIDILRFQVAEIEASDPKPGEGDLLRAQLTRLQHMESLSTSSAEALHGISADEESALVRLGSSVRALESSLLLDPSIEPVLESLRSALYALEDGARELGSYVEGLESDPALLEKTAERIDALNKLRRKYGDTEEAILGFLHEACVELQELEGGEACEEELEAGLGRAERELAGPSKDLSNLRQERAREFSTSVETQMRDLAMPRAILETRLSLKACDPSGIDSVEFFFSANAGEPARPLSKIASGGEISRVMLALKVVLAGKAGVPTMIFDEVDSGLGGQAAAVVARKLEELAHNYQVVTITHLPQIASRAEAHFKIEKELQGGRSITVVRRLDQQERVEEIARMLAGEEVGQSALENARELMRVGA